MRLLAAITAFAGLLLSMAGEATAAVNWAPRMERLASCSWDRPGHNPFMGDVVAAIDRYIDIPTLVRVRLKQRMQARQYDDLVAIRRDEITGRERYAPAIRDMHFGLDRVCRQVTRERWTATMQERGLVYCEQGHCILVPTVCRNVSRIERRPALLAATTIADPGEAPLDFPAPSAGPSDAGADAPATPALSRAPTAGSSIAEAVSGAGEPPSQGGTGIEPGAPWPPGFGPWPWWPSASGGGGTVPASADGGGWHGGSGGSSSSGGGFPADSGGGGGGGGSGGGGGGHGGGGGGAGGGDEGFPDSGGGGGFPDGEVPGGNGGFPDGGSGGFPDGGGSGFPDGGGSGFPDGGGGGSFPDSGAGGGGGSGGDGGDPIAKVPEPGTLASLLLGLASLALVSARQRRQRRDGPR